MQDKNQNKDMEDAEAAVAAIAAPSLASQADFVRKIVEKIKASENILIAVSKAPSVDELSAAIGLALFLDSIQHHTTAVFSGQVPTSLGFLSPEMIFEVNTASLQDFIVALDKEKADHLRYKLESDYVKVFITPYKTTITEKDLTFMRGDYNVDFVIALNVRSAGDIDPALLEESGKIMHSASAVNITCGEPGRFGEIEWSNVAASSVCEMVTELIFALQGQDTSLDRDVATALLAGIVAATQRFSNNRTSPETLTLASKLMAMGADQQLISANVIDNAVPVTAAPVATKPAVDPGSFVLPPVETPTLQTKIPNGAVAGGQAASVSNPAAQAAQGMVAPTGPAPANVTIPGNVAPAAAPATDATPVTPKVATSGGAAPANTVPASTTSASATSGAANVAGTANALPSRPMATAEPTQTARPQVGVPVQPPAEEGPKDYGAMMAQALSEPLNSAAVVTPVVPPAALPGDTSKLATPKAMSQPTPAAPTTPATQQPAASTASRAGVSSPTMTIPTPAGQPVARPDAVLRPAPMPPTSGPDMMPPSLPPVQVPTM